jgi:hypothetical protein
LGLKPKRRFAAVSPESMLSLCGSYPETQSRVLTGSQKSAKILNCFPYPKQLAFSIPNTPLGGKLAEPQFQLNR